MPKHLTDRAQLNEEHVAELVERSCDGDRRAWQDLWVALAPFLEEIAGRWRVSGRLAESADERNDIVVNVMGMLLADGARRLRELRGLLAQRDGSCLSWLARVAINAGHSHVREHSEYLGPVEGGGGRWASLVSFAEEPEGDGADPIDAIEIQRILMFAREACDPQRFEALRRWLEGEDEGEIAAALQLEGGTHAAQRLVRTAVDRLRTRFAKRKPVTTIPAAPPGRPGGGSSMLPPPQSRRGTRRSAPPSAHPRRAKKIDRCVRRIGKK